MNRRLLLAALACAAAACANVEATSVQYVGVPRFPPADAAAVRVLPGEPAPPVTDIEQRLREEAAKMGASAVYVIRDVLRPGESRKLVGIAIRYR
jgi:hypothetical protein